MMVKAAIVVGPVRDDMDMLAVRELFEEYIASLGLDLSFQNVEVELRELPGRYASPSGVLLLASDSSDRPVGCLGVRALNEPSRCELKRLYVREAARGSGTGRSLLQAAVSFAAARGYREMLLDVLPTMAAARALYSVFRFTPIAPYYDSPLPGVLFLPKTL